MRGRSVVLPAGMELGDARGICGAINRLVAPRGRYGIYENFDVYSDSSEQRFGYTLVTDARI